LKVQRLQLKDAQNYEALKREHVKLAEEVNRLIKLLQKDGTYDQLMETVAELGLDTELNNAEEVIAKLMQKWTEDKTALTPYPGTPIYEHAKKNNLLLTEDWSKYTGLEPTIKIEGVSSSKLKSLLQRAYLTFYLTPKNIYNWLKNRQFTFIKSALKALTNYIQNRNNVKENLSV
jgi:radical SAM superfamily enzyme YgiQ (UPF0313 family)